MIVLYDNYGNKLRELRALGGGFVNVHVYDPSEAVIFVHPDVQVSAGNMLTVFGERDDMSLAPAIETLIIEEVVMQDDRQRLNCFGLTGWLDRMVYFDRDNPTQPLTLGSSTGGLKALFEYGFSDFHKTVTLVGDIPPYENQYYRLSTIFNHVRSFCILNNVRYGVTLDDDGIRVRFTTNTKLDMTVLVQDLGEQIKRIQSIKEQYHRIIGLGAGEMADRDSHIEVDYNVNNDTTYVYDVREAIDYDTLVARTRVKFLELKSAYELDINVNNDIITLGTDYKLGDTIKITTPDGYEFEDMITVLDYRI